MSWTYAELVVVSLAAMLSPTTLTFSILAVVLAERPVRTGALFWIGAFGAMLAIGILAAVVIGDAAASGSSTPKTWVAVLDIVFAVFLVWYAWHLYKNPFGADKQQSMVDQMQRVASSSWIAVVGAGAVLANAGAYIPVALKTISETDPSTTQYIVEWVFFAFVSIVPLFTAVILLVVAPRRAEPLLDTARAWLQRNLTLIAIVIICLVAASLLRGGIAGLTS